jgi:hypothetical protein
MVVGNKILIQLKIIGGKITIEMKMIFSKTKVAIDIKKFLKKTLVLSNLFKFLSINIADSIDAKINQKTKIKKLETIKENINS